MVAADGERRDTRPDDRAEMRLDVLVAALERETAAERHVADIGRHHVGGGGHAEHVLVRPDPLDRTHRARAETGAGPVGDAEIHRHADERHVETAEIRQGRRGRPVRQVEEGRDVGERPSAAVAL